MMEYRAVLAWDNGNMIPVKTHASRVKDASCHDPCRHHLSATRARRGLKNTVQPQKVWIHRFTWIACVFHPWTSLFYMGNANPIIDAPEIVNCMWWLTCIYVLSMINSCEVFPAWENRLACCSIMYITNTWSIKALMVGALHKKHHRLCLMWSRGYYTIARTTMI